MDRVINTDRGAIVLRPLEMSDLDAVLSLWHAAFDGDMDVELWRWKYFGDAYGSQVIVGEAESGELVTLFGGIPMPANLRGREVLVTHMTDNMSHPNYRGVLTGRRGIYVRTVHEFIDSFCGPEKSVFLYGFPGVRHYKLGKYTLNYGELQGGMAYLKLNLPLITDGKRRPFGRLEAIETPGQRFDHLMRELKSSYPFYVLRDSKFINWRFFDHPFNQYLVFGYRSVWSKSLHGFFVVKIDGAEAVLVDYILPTTASLAHDFILRTCSELANMDLTSLSVWAPGWHESKNCFASLGFEQLPEPKGIVPTGRSFVSDLDWPWASANFYYTMGDGDLF